MQTPVRQSARHRPQLILLGGFKLIVHGSPVTVPIHAQRVLAYLSVVQPNQPVHPRASLAERLWSDVPANRSHASLRTALWRIRQADTHLVQASRETLRLSDTVDIDVRRGVAQAGRLITGPPDLQPQDVELDTLLGDLLPGWDEDWLLLERERLRQVQVHALETLTHRLRRLGRFAEAVEAAYAAIAHEPLRESAHAALIDVFLAEGNIAQARRQLTRYAGMLWTEMRVAPSPALTGRVTGAGGEAQPTDVVLATSPVR